MRKIICLLLVLSLLFIFASCGKKDQTAENGSAAAVQEQTQTASSVSTAPPPGNSTSNSSSDSTPAQPSSAQSSTSTENTDTADIAGAVLMQSASVDLDADGENEQIEVLEKEAEDKTQSGVKELEGILRISGKKGNTDTVFITKADDQTGIMNGMEFKDLDGDGVKDVFIIIPDSGAQFALNYFFAYSYASGKSYKFNTDAFLSDFARGFKFTYKDGGVLEMKNDGYGISADFAVAGDTGGASPGDGTDSEYENAWVEPSPVVIGADSQIALKTTGGATEIKVPLPVFGMGTVDMIGEINMYYALDADFTPVLKHFDVMDFNGDMSLKKIGEWKG